MNTKRIIKVIIKRMNDEDGQADWLGKYSSTPGPEATTIDRQARADWKPGEYRYFIATMSGEETGNPESVEQAYKRMEAGMNGGWHLMGVRAEAEAVLTGSIVQKLTSGGLWGVESDTGDEYIKGVEAEELEALKGELLAVGFTDEEIKAAFEKVERKNEL